MSNRVQADEGENIEFKWKKMRRTGGKKKEVRFYESFTYDGVDYTLYDCVYLYKEGEPEPYIGKLIKIWELPNKTKKVKILWFFRPSDIANCLGDVQAHESELFLASGEGVGLANINPLESIAGKCNVVCTSKDSRNPQPSKEELWEADFIFHRTFNVEHRKILDKIDEKIADIDVKFIFNRKECPELANVLQQDSDKVIDSSSNLLVKDNVGVKGSPVTLDAAEIIVPGATEDHAVCDKATLMSKVDFDKIEGEENRILFSQALLEEKVKSPRVVEEGCLPEEASLRSEVDCDKVHRNLVKHASLEENLKSSRLDAEGRHLTGGNTSKVDNDKIPGTQASSKEKMKSSKDFSALDNRPLKKAKADTSHILSEEEERNEIQKVGFNGNAVKTLVTDVSTHENTKSKRAKDSLGTVNGPSKRLKLVEDMPKPSNSKLVKASPGESPDYGRKNNGPGIPKSSNSKLAKASPRGSPDDGWKNDAQLLEVTRRPNTDSSRWFKGPPWEERLQAARKQGKLVLLQNLDPAYTSAEVEDILFHGFKESCTAKMIQRTAISSPHSGQAYVVFKTREAAERVVRELDERCLMLSNGRPLVGSICNTNFLDSSFVGHLSVDRAKPLQQRGETKQAVSTSHCSQPNTIEYEMAMEWCLLQMRSDSWWKELYKAQGQQMRKLKADLKSKTSLF